jgi:ABC-type sugar transport system ATPase subunit
VILEVNHLGGGPRVRDVSFALHRGEVLGLAGLVGAGRTETARLIFGADRPERGEVRLEGQVVRFRSPEDAVQSGIVYVPEDRKALGLVLMHSVRQNMSLPSLSRLSRSGVVNQAAVTELVDGYIKRLGVRTPSSRQMIELLSGGNQQKVVLAKWLAMRPRVLILDEPTRGIDVNAKAEVFALVREVAAQGVAVLLISSETPEILRESNRIIVFHQGRVVGELEAATATEKQVVGLAFGQLELQEHRV